MDQLGSIDLLVGLRYSGVELACRSSSTGIHGKVAPSFYE